MIKFRLNKDIGIIGVLTITLSLSVFLFTFHQNRRINDLTKMYKSIENRPILKLVGDPICQVRYVNPFDSKIFLNVFQSDSLLIMLKETFVIKNTGTDKAQIQHFLSITNNTKSDTLRKLLFDKDKLRHHFYQKKTDDFKVQEVFPGDTIHYNILSIAKIGKFEKSFARHIIFIFDSEIGNRYDSYIRYQYLLNYPLFVQNNSLEPWYYGLIDSKQIIIGTASINHISKVYTDKEKLKMIKLMGFKRVIVESDEVLY